MRTAAHALFVVVLAVAQQVSADSTADKRAQATIERAMRNARGHAIQDCEPAKTQAMDSLEERQLGARLAEGLHQKFGAPVSDEVSTYVQQVGDRLARGVSRTGLSWTFEVLPHPTPRIQALPGGVVVLSRGALVGLKNEAELAAVLGPEIIHVDRDLPEVLHDVNYNVCKLRVVDKYLKDLPPDPGGTTLADAEKTLEDKLLYPLGAELELAADASAAELLRAQGYPLESMLRVVHAGSMKPMGPGAKAPAAARSAALKKLLAALPKVKPPAAPAFPAGLKWPRR